MLRRDPDRIDRAISASRKTDWRKVIQARNCPLTDPADRNRTMVNRMHKITGPQRFNPLLAVGCINQRSRHKAGDPGVTGPRSLVGYCIWVGLVELDRGRRRIWPDDYGKIFGSRTGSRTALGNDILGASANIIEIYYLIRRGIG